MTARTAFVLTWDSNTVRVRCPYSCNGRIHTHGFTRPEPGKPNRRAPHCTPSVDDDGNYVFSPDYRLLFPFEEDPEAEGMWWELDYHKKRWRTISWKIYDPDYWEDRDDPSAHTEDETSYKLDGQTSEQDVSDIANALSDLRVHGLEVQTQNDGRNESESESSAEDATRSTNKLPGHFFTPELTWTEKSVFESFCVCNSVEKARRILFAAADASKLVNGALLNGKPILLAVVEEGHGDVVEFLLNHGADLESKDSDGNTALSRALQFGRGTLAEKLINAGASLDTSNNSGESVRDIAQASLDLQQESSRIERMMIHPREPPLVPIDVDKDKLRNGLVARSRDICALQRIIESCDQMQNLKQFLVQVGRIGEMYGAEQAKSVQQHGELNDQALLVHLLLRVMATPRETVWKTVACLTRGTALPWTFAVSGYCSSQHDGALHQPFWIARVFDLAKLIGHDLPADDRDRDEKDGSFLACHSEKQLLAYFVWNHTTKLFTRGGPSLRRSEAQQISKLHAEIYVGQPDQDKAFVCNNCYAFCERIVLHFGFRLTLKGVVRGEIAWITEFPPPQTYPRLQ